MEPRDYQLRAVEDCRREYARGARSVLLVVPTGGGKTVIGALVVAGALAKGKRVLWLAGRRELVDQAAARLPGRVGILMAGRPTDPGAPVQVGSIDTILNRDVPVVDLVVYDEAHHAVANTSRQVLARQGKAHLLGLTATPVRGDGAALGDIFDALVIGPTVRELVAQQHLVPVSVVAPKARYSTLSEDPVSAWRSRSEGRPGFAFHKTIAESRAFTERLNAEGVATAHVDGETPLAIREAAIRAFREGELECLSSVFVFTEGVDVPRASFCLLARGCDNPGTYLQMVGRVLRPHRGKHDALVVDLRGVVHDHGLPDDDRKWSLDGVQGQVTEAAKRMRLRQCIPCAYVWRPVETNEQCPRCGYQEEARPQHVVARSMGAVRAHAPRWPNADKAQRDEYLRRLYAEARKMNYRRGWIEARMRWAFGG